MLGRTALRFTVEAAVIIAVAVGIALDSPSWSKVIAVMVPVYVLVAGFEWLVSRGRRPRGAAPLQSDAATAPPSARSDAQQPSEGASRVSVFQPHGEEPVGQAPDARMPATSKADPGEPAVDAEAEQVEPSVPPPALAPESQPTPVLQPQALQPEQPGALQPERSETLQPQALQPERPGALQPEQPEASRPEAFQPEQPEALPPQPPHEPPRTLEPEPPREVESRPEPVREAEPTAPGRLESEPPPPPEPEPEPAVERPPLVAAPPLPPEPEPEQPAAPVGRDVVPLVQRGPRAWNIWELERLSREHAGGDSMRDEERAYLLVYLREFAGADGLLPVDFDGLVRESFGDLVGTG